MFTSNGFGLALQAGQQRHVRPFVTPKAPQTTTETHRSCPAGNPCRCRQPAGPAESGWAAVLTTWTGRYQRLHLLDPLHCLPHHHHLRCPRPDCDGCGEAPRHPTTAAAPAVSRPKTTGPAVTPQRRVSLHFVARTDARMKTMTSAQETRTQGAGAHAPTPPPHGRAAATHCPCC